VNGHLLVILLPRDRALRTWVADFPSKVFPYLDPSDPKSFTAAFISDAYMFAGSDTQKNRVWADLDFLPGQHEVIALLPDKPAKAWIDGVLTEVEYERERRTARLKVTTPALPLRPIDLNSGQAWVERFDSSSGQWQSGLPGALEDTGPVPYGYVKYKAQFDFTNQPKMFISTFTKDALKVFINGKLVEEALKPAKLISFDLAKYANPGTNTLEISYEAFGADNGDVSLGDLKGIEFVRLGSDAQGGVALSSWQVQPSAAPMRGRGVDASFAGVAWSQATFEGTAAADPLVPAFTWCQTKFSIPGVEPGWLVPWKLTFDADRDALIYLNGRFVGRYVTVGPQKEFYLPGPDLAAAGENTLSFLLAYTDRPTHLRALRVGPYQEFSPRRSRLEFQWQ